MAYKIINCGDHRQRRSFSRIKNTYALTDLLEIQKKSYQWFIEKGIKEVFEDLFPVENFSGTLSLEFGDYHLDEPRYTIRQSKDRETTYAAPLKVEVRLFNHETGEVKEQEIFLGDMPIMTDSGSFVINGAERVIVSQLVRSPSVYFNVEVDKNGRNSITSQIIPTRGTWLEYETDARDVLYVRIDRTRKVPLTTLLRAFGLSSDEDIIKVFGKDEYIENTLAKDSTRNTDEALIEIYEKLRPGEPATLDSSKNQIITRFFDEFRYDLARVGRYKFNRKLNVLDRVLNQTLAEDIIVDGNVVIEKGTVINKDVFAQLKDIFSNGYNVKETKINEELDYYKNIMNIPVDYKIHIKNVKTILGSNSLKTKSLTFSIILIHYPLVVIDSIVVHELAHYFYRNHSKNFYNVVYKYFPDYKKGLSIFKKGLNNGL